LFRSPSVKLLLPPPPPDTSAVISVTPGGMTRVAPPWPTPPAQMMSFVRLTDPLQAPALQLPCAVPEASAHSGELDAKVNSGVQSTHAPLTPHASSAVPGAHSAPLQQPPLQG